MHIDHEVWERLVKYASSAQCEEKSEQGRKANASRRTFGRTGSRGVNGVRERLREEFNRSPDPDEMERELQRDKGYGGYKKKRVQQEEEEKEYTEVLSDENSPGSQSRGHASEDRFTEDNGSQHRNFLSSAEKVGASAMYRVNRIGRCKVDVVRKVGCMMRKTHANRNSTNYYPG